MTADPTSTYFPLLSLLLWLPVAGALVCLSCYRKPEASRWIALATAAILFVLSLTAIGYTNEAAGWFLYEDANWVETFGIRYTLGMDGISLLLIILTAFLQLIAIMISWQQDKYQPLFFALVLTLETAIIGVFLALDLILFYSVLGTDVDPDVFSYRCLGL